MEKDFLQTMGAALFTIMVIVCLTEGAATAQLAAIIGPTWVAEDIAGKGVMDNLQSTITFTDDGTVHGTGGCNRFQGGYTIKGEKLEFGQLAATSMACRPAIDEQELRFHQALRRTRGYRIDKGLLLLVDENGQPQMRLWKRD